MVQLKIELINKNSAAAPYSRKLDVLQQRLSLKLHYFN
jgi:hypothetical protein